MSDQDLDRDLAAAVEADLNQEARPLGAPISPGRQERLRVLKRAEGNGNNPAMEQLATAIQGLLKMEEELQQLARDLVGDFKLDETDREVPTPSTGQPLIPRLRSDAELLARLAIRQHKLIAEIRSRL